MFLFIDYTKGFGGKYGVQKDRQDAVCLYPYYIFIFI